MKKINLKIYSSSNDLVFIPACDESRRIAKRWVLTKSYLKILILMGYTIEVIKHDNN